VRLALFYLFLLAAQGFLGALLAPLAAPDLFLLAVVALLWRLPPYQLVLLGYGIGLLQDVIGHGQLGVHAFGLAGAAMGAVLVRSQLKSGEILSRMLVVLTALLCKWLVMIPLLVWLSGTLDSLVLVPEVVLVEIIFTFLASFLIIPWADGLLERSLLMREEAL
jgi:rod shape-determining protein MreD